MSLAGKVALVTGSTQGIGLGMLRALAGAGSGACCGEGGRGRWFAGFASRAQGKGGGAGPRLRILPPAV